MTADSTLSWLLEPESPIVRYRAAVELNDGRDSQKYLTEIDYLKELGPIIQKARRDKYWYYTNPKTKKSILDPLHYKNQYYIFRVLQFLAEYRAPVATLGLDSPIEQFLDNIRSPQNSSLLDPCHYPDLVRPLVILGYREHDSVRQLIDRLLSSIRWDNGLLCSRLEKKTRQVKSCVLGTIGGLMAFSELPDLWDTPECKRMAEYFIRRELIFRTTSSDYVHRNIGQLAFPLGWNVLSILYALTKMGYGAFPQLKKAFDFVESKRDEQGRYPLDLPNNYSNESANRLPDVGKRHFPNKWVTFYVLLSHKQQEDAAKRGQ